MEPFEIRAHVSVFIILVAFHTASLEGNPAFGMLQPLFILGTAIVYGFVLLNSLLYAQNRLRQ